MRALASILVAVALSAAACGGGEVEPSIWYAGMNQGDALMEAMNAARREVNDPESPIYRHRIRPGTTAKSKNSLGDDAWVVRLPDLTTKEPVCVWLWADTFLNVRNYNYEIDFCG